MDGKSKDNARHGGQAPARRTRRFAETWVLRLGAAMLAGVLGFAPRAAAQSCALCYTTASAAGSAGIRALHVGILALLIPALGLFLGILYLVIRRAALAEV
jgi:hypothetical protein